MKLLKTLNIVPMVRNLGLFFSLILAIVFSMYAAQYPTGKDPYVPVLSSNFYYEKSKAVVGWATKVDPRALKFILETDLPVISEKSSDKLLPNTSSVVQFFLNLLSGVKLNDPLSYLKSEIPMMDIVPVTAEITEEFSPSEVTEPSKPKFEKSSQEPVVNKISSTTPLIALYNTHTSETYELTDGLTHIKGKAGAVSIVAKEIEKTIQKKYKIAAVYSPLIHDLSYNKSYIESEKTVKQLLKDNPKLEMMFDIHRDGMVSRENSVTKINGKNVAKIMIVVGTNARVNHPKWRENLEFARKLNAKMDSMYPGLSRGISIKQGRYNQQYSTQSILVEIGSAKNTTDEAVESARLFADIVVAVLNDISKN